MSTPTRDADFAATAPWDGIVNKPASLPVSVVQLPNGSVRLTLADGTQIVIKANAITP